MKIVVKQCDKYTSELHADKELFEYLIYVYTDDMTPLGCEQVIGEVEREQVVKHFVSIMIHNGDIKTDENTTHEKLYDECVDFVSYSEFKEAIKNDEGTYNG